MKVEKVYLTYSENTGSVETIQKQHGHIKIFWFNWISMDV